MHPVVSLELAGHMIKVGSYQLFAVLAALLGSITAIFMLRRIKAGFLQAVLLIAVSGCGFLTGARLWNYAVNFHAYDENFRIWTLKLAGFSVYGGILGAMAVLIPFSRLIRKTVYELLDALVLPAGLAFAIARIGCYLNGCCSGRPTDSFVGVRFPSKSGLAGVLGESFPLIGSIHRPVYPTQLFEMALALLGLILPVWVYLGKKPPVGVCFLIYFIWAGAMRLLVLPFRELSYPSLVVKAVYPLLYAVMIVTASVLLAARLRSRSRPPFN